MFKIQRDLNNGWENLKTFEEIWTAALNYKIQHPKERILPNDNPSNKLVGFSTSDSNNCWMCPEDSHTEFLQKTIENVGFINLEDFRLATASAITQGIKFEDFDYENWHLLCNVHLT